MPLSKLLGPVLAVTFLLLGAGYSFAEGPKTYEITLEGTTFTPAEFKVEAGKPFRIQMTNKNTMPAELESNSMGFEKIASGSSQIIVNVRPQKPGKYEFEDEFHPEAKGYIIVE